MAVHATQVPVLLPGALGKQCGVAGLLAQSRSVPPSFCGSQVVAEGCTQVWETLHTRPLEQSALETHCTHWPPVEQRAVGGEQSASELQPLLLTHT